MLSIEEALERILTRARQRDAIVLPAGEALGCILAEDVKSDVDSPPHDKSVVDGYAVVAADLAGGTAELDVLEEVIAGAIPHRAVTPGLATRIMTGAPLPEGADAVVMIERADAPTTAGGTQRVRLNAPGTVKGQNIVRRATSMARGHTILSSGCVLRAVELGLLAEVGRSEVRVVPTPSLAVLSTGNELVPASAVPGPGQIRNSNGPLLTNAARMAGADAVDLGIVVDEREALSAAIGRGLENDILVLSGGVSAGVLDLVPGALAARGVEQIFHKINLKPGKPLWFGICAQADGDRLVFGLPGNPVSSLVCFELFVRPAIGRLRGRDDAGLVEVSATLAQDMVQRSDRLTYYPARLTNTEGQELLEPLHWQGSGDLCTLASANALAILPPGRYELHAGHSIRAVRLPGVR
jgi:molybdopterin molybdotransferase